MALWLIRLGDLPDYHDVAQEVKQLARVAGLVGSNPSSCNIDLVPRQS